MKFIRISAFGFSFALLLSALVLPSAMPILFGPSYEGTVALTLILMTAYQFQFLRDLLSTYANSKQMYTRSFIANIVTVSVFLAISFSARQGLNLVLFAAVILASFLVGFALHIAYMLTDDKWEPKSLLKLTTLSLSLILVLALVQGIPQLLTSWRLI